MSSNGPTRRLIGTHRPRFSEVVGMKDRNVAPCIGKLKLGAKEKVGTSKEHPTELDYFRCVPDEGFSAEERKTLIENFDRVYGERAPRLHEVYFPSDDLDFVLPHPLQAWGKTDNGPKLLCEGNGVDAVRLDFESGNWIPRACCHAQECEWYNAKKCGMKARLRVFLPLVTISGYWQIDTGSEIGVGNTLQVTQHIKSVFGHLRGIPFTLSREEEMVPYGGKLNKHWILHLWAPNVTLSEAKALVARQGQLAIAGDVELVEPDPDEDIPEDLVPLSEQGVPVDPELLKKIEDGFDILGTSQSNRQVHLHRYKGREKDLLVEINNRINLKQPERVGAE